MVGDGKFNSDFLPDEDAIRFGADGEGQYLYQLHVFLKHMTRHWP